MKLMPYGGSVTIASTLLSGSVFIVSRQSPCNSFKASVSFLFRVPVPDGLLDFVFDGRLLVMAFILVADFCVGCADVEFAAVELATVADILF